MRKRIDRDPEPSWQTADGHSPFVSLFMALHPVSRPLTRYLDQETYSLHLPKGSFLAKPGLPSENLYLICRGVARCYRKLGDKEITTWINEEGEIIGSIQGLGEGNRNEAEYIQALEELELVVLPKASVEFLYSRFPETNIIARKVLEESYRAAEERAFLCRIPSAEMKYQCFLRQRPQLINRIPLRHIASYLGMRLETLSRMRKKDAVK